MLNQGPSATKTAWIWANINVPEMVEYLATTVEIRHWDSGGKNFYVFRDASSTGRWQILSWDLDGIFSGGSDTKGDFITPDITGNKLYKSLFEIPQIKEMYFRRLRTLHDQYLTGTGFQTRFNQLTAGKDADRVLDKNKWGGADAVQPDHEGRRRREGAAHPDRRAHQRHRGPDQPERQPQRGDQRDPPAAGHGHGQRGVPRAVQPLDHRGRRHLRLADQGRRLG